MATIRLGTIRFRLNGLFLLVLFIFALYDLLPQAIMVFTMVLLHESAHLFTAWALSLKVVEVELLPFGGVARLGEELALYPMKEILVAAVGPLTSLLLGSIFFYLVLEGEEKFLFLAKTNLTIGLFNLLPAIPLDGGRILRSLLSIRRGLYRGTKEALMLAKLMALILGGVSIGGIVSGRGSISLLLISFFVYYKVGEEDRGIHLLMMKYILKKREYYGSKDRVPLAFFVVRESLTLQEILQYLYPHSLHIFYIVDDQLTLQGVLLEMEIIDYLLEGKGFSTTMGQLMGE